MDLHGFEAALLGVIEFVSLLIEVLAVVIIVVSIVFASSVYIRRRRTLDTYTAYRVRLGRALGLGLTVLVAADVIRTVALQPTIGNVVVLGLLVLVRTFLSWSLVVEIEGRWPWQPERLADSGPVHQETGLP
jgi:uncharacterized membrane protein